MGAGQSGCELYKLCRTRRCRFVRGGAFRADGSGLGFEAPCEAYTAEHRARARRSLESHVVASQEPAESRSSRFVTDVYVKGDIVGEPGLAVDTNRVEAVLWS